ncbi:hypothetical protein ALC62_08050, partial [Cyphomyrmex costatus]
NCMLVEIQFQCEFSACAGRQLCAIRRSTSAARTIEVSDYNFACISSKTVATQNGLLLSGTANSP